MSITKVLSDGDWSGFQDRVSRVRDANRQAAIDMENEAARRCRVEELFASRIQYRNVSARDCVNISSADEAGDSTEVTVSASLLLAIDRGDGCVQAGKRRHEAIP